jgi:RNA polymerase sigma factor (sigma-70 family)
MLIKEKDLIDLAISGDSNALEKLISGSQDMIFNLALRILGSPHDAEDATQEILIKIIRGLPQFRRESAFSTWAYRIAVNYLYDYRKSMFAERPLSFEFYAEDILQGFAEERPELFHEVDENLLTEELKQSCTNVMLQCLDSESRCVYVLGTMFHMDSKVAGEILGMSAETYRQRLVRTRKRMAEFLQEYCGLAKGCCNCRKRVGYAIRNGRLIPHHLEYTLLGRLEEEDADSLLQTMEQLDTVSLLFSNLPKYKYPKSAREFIVLLHTAGDLIS